MIRAVVFDFDGTIVDTETLVYEAWKLAFEAVGATPIDLELWQGQIGLADADSLDPRAELCRQLGIERVPDEVEAHRRAERDRMLAEAPIRAGVVEWLAAAESTGLRLAVASSSTSEWVEPNLARLGLRHRFEAVSCADPGIPGKPDPTVYLDACRSIDVEPSAAVAIEDSTNGVIAARRAGMAVIAAPGPMTRRADFSEAHHVADSLADVDPAAWLPVR